MQAYTALHSNTFKIVFSYSEKHYIQLMSDLHLGAEATSEKNILRDLKSADAHDARILINGDLFDGILPSDKKRYQPQTIKQALLGKDDLINQTIDYAYDFLKPYQHRIDGIAMGNHENAILQHHSLNLITLLINRLNQDSEHKVKYLGYSGFVMYHFEYKSGGSRRRTCIYYHHGTGGGNAPVTKGVIQYNRANVAVEGADVIWLGHNHERMVFPQCKVFANALGNVKFRDCWCIRSGSYMNYIDNGYPVKKNLYPQCHGGAMVQITTEQRKNRIRVIQ